MNKYTLIKEDYIEIRGIKLYRIKALKSFSDIKKGDIGGYIEKKDNLNQTGDAWVSGDAKVFGDATVSGNARVFGDAQVSGNAWVYGEARVYGNARVSENAHIYGYGQVFGDA